MFIDNLYYPIPNGADICRYYNVLLTRSLQGLGNLEKAAELASLHLQLAQEVSTICRLLIAKASLSVYLYDEDQALINFILINFMLFIRR